MMCLAEGEYGRLFHKALMLIHRRDLEALEKAAKLLLVAKVLRLEGLAVALEAFVKRVGLHEQEIPDYLKPIFGHVGSYDGWLQAAWNLLAKKAYGLRCSFVDDLRIWWMHAVLGGGESLEATLVLALLDRSGLPEGWRLDEVEKALCL